jgi:hypothetical protein
MSIKGSLDPTTLQADLALDMKHSLGKAEMAFILTSLGVRNLSAEGTLAANLTISGSLREPESFKSQGTVKLDSWTVSAGDRFVSENLATVVKVNDRRFEFDDFKAACLEGRLDGSFYLEFKKQQPFDFGGRLLAQRISLAGLTFALAGAERKAAKGLLTASYSFTGKGRDLAGLKGEALILLDDADMRVLPVVPQIFAAIGLSSYDPLKMSDAEGIFSTDGPLVTIQRAHIANSFAAVEAEPGGTINLQTRRIDAHVVGSALKHVDMVIQRVPLINILANLKNKLTRLRVRGNWSDPPSKLITKQPITDIKEGTVGFLRDVVKSGGQLGKGVLDGLGGLFQNGQDRKK